MHHPTGTANDNSPRAELSFDWQLDVHRFASAAAQARESGIADPWTIAEIDCAFDLIDAELAALRNRPQDEERVRESVRLLTLWRTRMGLARRTLEAVARQSRTSGAPHSLAG